MDYNATTPLHPEVKKTMTEAFEIYGNASSMHSSGRLAGEKVAEAREIVARFLGAEPEEIIFTGGGSESNNTVLKMLDCGSGFCSCLALGRKGLVTTAIEHPSIINTAEFLQHKGVPVTFVPVDKTGKVNMEELEAAVSNSTAVVSVMMGNNEIGTLQDIKTITRLVHERGALMHTDAVQTLGKVPVNVNDLGVDFLSFSAHKLYGPKGIGILYIRKGTPFCTLIHGGHQEEGRRAGTYNTLGIIGLGKAVELASQEMKTEVPQLWKLREKLRKGIEERVPDIYVNGHPTDTLPGTLNISFRGCEGEAILLYLDMNGIQVSTGSACASGSLEPSHVLLATGVEAELAHGSIRFSLGRDTTEADVDYVLEKLPPILQKIRNMSTMYSGRR
jgi:cysteine desulfurase